MNTALLQYQLGFAEINQLIKEFPQYLFLSFPDSTLQFISPEHWPHVEILFSSHLSATELDLANQLRWIHCPTSNLQRLCLEEIEKKGNILVTTTKDENYFQIAEFVMASVLVFAKNLTHWKEANRAPMVLWDSKWRNNMWSMTDKVFLQIGMGQESFEITLKAKQFGMKVWGMDRLASYHPHCNKTFSFSDLQYVLPKVDVVSIFLPRDKEFENWFSLSELELMKEDSILIIIGSSKVMDEEALAKIAHQKRFRGIVIDAQFQTPISPQSPIWGIPNLIVTPEVASRPKIQSNQAYRTFLYNMRQFVHGNFIDMKNLLSSSMLPSVEEYEWIS